MVCHSEVCLAYVAGRTMLEWYPPDYQLWLHRQADLDHGISF